MPFEFNLPPLAQYQIDAIFDPAPRCVIEASTKAGKTFGCLCWLLSKAIELGKPGRKFWWVAYIYYQAEEVAYKRMCLMLAEADPLKKTWKCNGSALSITLGNGATIEFRTAENPDGLYGEDVYAAVIDEASRARPEAWHAVRSTLTATNGALRLIGNVKGRKNWAYAIARKAEKGDMQGWKFARITADDAVREGILTADQIASAKAELPEHVFRELYECEASDDGANPFGVSHITACVQVIEPGVPAVWGVDLAKSHDWTVAIGLDLAGRVVQFHRWQGPWEETSNRLASLVGHTPALMDSTGVGDPIVEGLQRRLPNVEGLKFTSTSKQQLMEGLAVAIQSGAVAFPEGRIVQELESFEYQHTRTGVRYSSPDGEHDDCVCALALAVQHLARVPTQVLATVTGTGRSKQDDDWAWNAKPAVRGYATAARRGY